MRSWERTEAGLLVPRVSRPNLILPGHDICGGGAGAVIGGNDAFTKLLLHCDGGDGSTTFKDSSGSAHSVTANGNAQIDTAQSQFGGAAALFDGTGDYLTVPYDSSLQFGTGDFTIDFWARPASLANNTFFSDRDGSGTTDSLIWFIDTGAGATGGRMSVVDESAYILGPTSDLGLSVNTWHHFSMTRASGTMKLWVDGVEVASGTVSNDFNNTTAKYIGHDPPGAPDYSGYIDEFRISKGVARWTASFTPPAHPYEGS